MTATLPPMTRFQPFAVNSSGAVAPIPGGKVYFYASGTATPQAVYAADGTTPLVNPLTLDANGATDFRLGSGLSYKIDLTDALGAPVVGWPVDNILDLASLAVMKSDLADGTTVGLGDALVGVKSDLSGSTARTQHDKNADIVSAADFPGATDALKVSAAIAAIKAGTGYGMIIIPADMDQSFDVPLLNLSTSQAIAILDFRPYHGIVDTNTPITAAAASGSDIVITAATLARPSVITVASHGLVPGQVQKMTISGATGNTAINGYHAVSYVSATQLSVDCDATAMSALGGSPVIKAPTVITFGAAHGLTSGQVTEIAITGSGASNLDGTWEATYASATTLSIQIPIGSAYSSGATVKYLNTAYRGSFGGARLYTEGRDNSGGYASELVVAGKQNPGLVLESLSDGTAPGYTNSNRATSIVVRKNGVGQWQLVSDPAFNGADIWSFQHLGTSKQLLTLHGNGIMVYGQKAAGMDYTVPIYTHNFRGQNFCFENSSGNLGFVWRLSDNTKRKIWTFDTTNDRITVGNTANTGNIWGVDDNGFVYTPVGASVASATTITPTGPIFHVTGTTTIQTINPPYTGFKGRITIIPDGLWTTNTSGNIALGTTAVVGKALTMIYDYNTSKWYPSY